jgi:hypothetical protein
MVHHPKCRTSECTCGVAVPEFGEDGSISRLSDGMQSDLSAFGEDIRKGLEGTATAHCIRRTGTGSTCSPSTATQAISQAPKAGLAAWLDENSSFVMSYLRLHPRIP